MNVSLMAARTVTFLLEYHQPLATNGNLHGFAVDFEGPTTTTGFRLQHPINPRAPNAPTGGQAGSSAAGVGGGQAATPPTPVAAPVVPTATAAMAPPSGTPVKEGGSKLTVGPNIKLKGVEITDCDTLVVEGTVEATMDSRVMHITEIGAFKGSADIDFAEIHGEFDGDLTMHQKLVIYSTGRVSGKIRYGKVDIQGGWPVDG